MSGAYIFLGLIVLIGVVWSVLARSRSDVWPGMAVLDVGCGRGRVMR